MHWTYISILLLLGTIVLYHFYNNYNHVEGLTQDGSGSKKCGEMTSCPECADLMSSDGVCYWNTYDQTCVTMSGDNTVSKCSNPNPDPDSSIIVHSSDYVITPSNMM